MRVLVAMSGGVDSSVAAALMQQEGHEVVGATMKLWGGPSDSGCCSVADVEDARRVAQQLGIAHHVFNFTSDFERDVVEPYVAGHAQGRTPNPCIACNAHLKFDRFLERAIVLGFDAIATGHHARVVASATGSELAAAPGPRRGQGPVLRPVHAGPGRAGPVAAARRGDDEGQWCDEWRTSSGLRTAAKPDSQDVCFISKVAGRGGFLAARMPVGGGRLVTTAGDDIGPVEALELSPSASAGVSACTRRPGPNAGTWSMSTWRAGRRRWGPGRPAGGTHRGSQPLVVGRRAVAGGHRRPGAAERPRPALAGDAGKAGRGRGRLSSTNPLGG